MVSQLLVEKATGDPGITLSFHFIVGKLLGSLVVWFCSWL